MIGVNLGVSGLGGSRTGPESILRVIYGGLPAQNGYAPMPAIGQEMSEQQVKDVTDYIRNAWVNSAPVMNSGSAVSEAVGSNRALSFPCKKC